MVVKRGDWLISGPGMDRRWVFIICFNVWREPSPDEVNDEDVADKEAAEREEIDKDKKGKVVDLVDSVRLYSKEEVFCLVTVHHHCGDVLNDPCWCTDRTPYGGASTS